MKKKLNVNYVGWLGHDNVGDEALFEAINGLLTPLRLLPAKKTQTMQSCSQISPITIIGGSTGIPEWIEEIKLTRYNYIFGAGVKDPSFYGYQYIFRERLKVKVLINRLKAFRRIGVRGPRSHELLTRWGIKSEVVGDPCFSLMPTNSIRKKQDKIAINLGSDGILWGMNEERVFGEIAKVCVELRKEGYDLVLIPFWEKNLGQMKKLGREVKASIFPEWRNVKNTLNCLASCKMLIGEKLHSLGLSAAAGTPFIGLEYQPKCRELAETVGFKDYVVRTDRIKKEVIMNMYYNLFENYDEMRNLLNKKVEIYRKKQIQFAASIIREIISLPDSDWKAQGFTRLFSKYLRMTDLFLFRKKPLWYAWDKIFYSNLMQYFT